MGEAWDLSFGVLEYYLVAANIIGFILYGFNMLLYNHTASGQIDAVLTIVSLLGGSLGIVLFILLFDRKSVKENMMSRVFVACVLVIQVVAYLFIKRSMDRKFILPFGNSLHSISS